MNVECLVWHGPAGRDTWVLQVHALSKGQALMRPATTTTRVKRTTPDGSFAKTEATTNNMRIVAASKLYHNTLDFIKSVLF